MKRLMVTIAMLGLALAVPGHGPAYSAEEALKLKWADLMPPSTPTPPDAKKLFFSGSTKATDGQPPPPPLAEGKFMSMKRHQPGGDKPPAVVTSLNGKAVSLGGYVVPLDFDNAAIKEFLLVPFVGSARSVRAMLNPACRYLFPASPR